MYKTRFTVVIILFISIIYGDVISQMENNILKIVEQLSPNVVQINVELKEELELSYSYSTDEIAGCGLILGEGNYIVTNYHISDKDNIKRIEVQFEDSDNAVEAELVGSDEMNDLALLKVKSIPYEVKPLKWGRIEDVKVGQFVIAIGDPLGLEKTVTFGMISKVKRDLFTYEVNPFIQSDLNLNSGNSGGPLINMAGEVIGINNKVNSFAFSVPVDVVLASIEKMKKGDVLKPYFGIEFYDINDNYRKFFADDSLSGVLVKGFDYQSPAEATDLEPGDIITAVNQEAIAGDVDKGGVYFRRMINESEIGSEVTLTVWRFGKTHQVNFRVIEEPRKKMRKGYECDKWGIVVKELTDKIIFKRSYKDSVFAGQLVIEEIENKNNLRYILDRGDVVAGFVWQNEILPINSIDTLIDLYEKHKDNEFVMFKIIRRDQILYPIIKRVDKTLETLEE